MLNDHNYQEALKKGYHLVLFSGESCANCVTMQPIIAGIVERNPIFTFHVVHVDENNLEDIQLLASEYGVMSVPTTLLVADGKLLGKVNGYQPEEILEIWLESKVEDHQKNI